MVHGCGAVVEDRLADWAQRTPHAPAIVAQDSIWTYERLAQRTAEIATQLVRRGIGPESRIGVSLPRTPDLVATLLGVLQAGAAYVPIDPGHPAERQRYIASDAGVALVVAPGSEVLVSAPASMPAPRAQGDHLAYVLYTSGSTGRPKGVAIARGSSRAFLEWAWRTYSTDELAGVVAGTSIGFDLSVFELFAPLGAGGAIVLVDSVLELVDLDDTRRAHVRLINTVPSAMAALLRSGAMPPATRTVNLAGEPLSRELVRRLHQTAPVRVVNLYGPTEDTTYSTGAELGRDEEGAPAIGHSLPGRRAYVLDESLRQVDDGTTGELYLAGPGLARGYVGRPDLTAERFVPDPFGPPGARMYRTGDLARRRHDGGLDYAGRIDNQIKVRGFRVEPEEIEARLNEHAAASAVFPHGGGLAAYVLEPRLPVADLQAELARSLPPYMLPARVVVVERLPLTANGKIDRRSLPPLPDEPAGDRKAPSTPIERRLASVWCDVLSRPRVDLDDDFWALGGHSLLAVQIVARVRERFQVELPLRALFDAPTLRALATSIAAAAPSAGRLTRARPAAPLPLSFAQQRLWFFAQLRPGDTSYNVGLAIELDGPLDRGALERALRGVCARHEALRTSFASVDGRPHQIIHDAPAVLPLEARDTDASGVDRRLRDGQLRSFDLAAGPPWRAALARLGPRRHALLMTFHHIVFDDTSAQVLVEDLAALYGAEVAGTPHALAPLAVQYADWSIWQRQELAGPRLAPRLAHRRQRLAGAPTQLGLPTDRPRPATPSSAGATRALPIPSAALRSCAEVSRRHGATLFMGLFAAMQLLLRRETGQDDFVVGVATAGREHVELERLIGCFVNLIPVRTDLTGVATLEEAIDRGRDEILDALSHQDVPFERLVEELRLPRVYGQAPLVQVAFGVNHAPTPSAEGGGVRFRAREAGRDEARFDLTVWVDLGPEDAVARWTYATDLFEATTIDRWHRDLVALLDARPAPPAEAAPAVARPTSAPARPRFPGARAAPAGLVKRGEAIPGTPLPVLYEARSADLDLSVWVASHRRELGDALDGAGGVLLRGFRIEDVASFRAAAAAASHRLIDYSERSSPRTELAQGIYTSTDHPAHQPIVLHNEQSYTLDWPTRIIFGCLVPAQQGGATPLADSRKVLRRLRPSTVEAFRIRGVLYVRNYHGGLGLRWQVAFQTEDRARVEQHCRRADIAWEWLPGDRLRTRQVRPAVRVHPGTSEEVWFNHALFFNVASLEPSVREAMRSALAEIDLPTQTFYGDGAAIEPAVLDELIAAYAEETVRFAWRRGDVLILDNMLVAHGREPFVGPRQVVTAMADPVQRTA